MSITRKIFGVVIGGVVSIHVGALEVSAQLRNTLINTLVNTGERASIQTERSIGQVVGGVIQVFLGLLGVAFAVIIVYGGFKWMAAEGEEKKIAEARGLMYQGIIGLAIVLGAYTIATFFVTALQEAAGFK